VEISEKLKRIRNGFSAVSGQFAAFARSRPVLSLSILFIVIGGFAWWGVSGFTFEIGRFFAAPSTASCGSLGGTVCLPRTASGCNAGYTDVGQKTTDCDSGYGFCCKPSSGGGAPSTSSAPGTPTDPSGACVFKTNFNAPEGAWFCNNLQCQLDGNPSGGQEYPPEGPAVRLNINVYNRSVEAPGPNGPIFVRYILDATPKCSNGRECYPPKDPLWSCTRPDGKEVDLGRNGSDFYDCYKPIVRVYDAVPVTCCANTGLPGDCYTIRETVPGSPGATPSATPTGSPFALPRTSFVPFVEPTPARTATPLMMPSGAAVYCSPVEQVVTRGGIARIQAVGGSGGYVWDVGGGIIVEQSLSSIGVRFGVSGTKTIRVTSDGSSAMCAVNVVIPDATPVFASPVASEMVAMTQPPRGSDADGDGVADRFECPNPDRCPDSDSDGVADWRDPGIRNRMGRVLSAAEVATGPGEATVLALIVGALASLLYVTYAHSPLARKREVEDIASKRDPLDFRS
jgi:hypothetical protein